MHKLINVRIGYPKNLNKTALMVSLFFVSITFILFSLYSSINRRKKNVRIVLCISMPSE